MTGEHLREKLNNQPIRLVDIAKKLKISPQSLENRLKAKDVKINFIVELSKAINKSVYFFIEGSDLESSFLNVNSNLSLGQTTKKDTSIESLLISALIEKMDASLFDKLNAIDQKIEYIECFMEAIKMKIEIEEELKKAISNSKKTPLKES